MVGACDIENLDSVASIRRILQIAIVDTLGLDDSLAPEPKQRPGPLPHRPSVVIGQV